MEDSPLDAMGPVPTETHTMAQTPAKAELESVKQFVSSHHLNPALKALPPLSAMTITPQTRFPSEHPYKLLLGSLPGQPLWLALTTTPKQARCPYAQLFVGDSDIDLKAAKWEQMEVEELVQPFRKFWEKTREGWGQGDGVLVFLGAAVRREERGGAESGGGGGFLVPTVIRRYLVEALKKIGRRAYSGGDGVSLEREVSITTKTTSMRQS
ncbi:hypothetical protein K458DRAFT_405977 [Lentithecium fluviatile CBS 122367]|uniref:Uncharacterized protein n=1 Tax=Lentithecium fluviatile CBS 122367 TaxID=1168545 RepID=A0A6G1IVV2_9PLEO|nr:hypothetical protein K458DRAFT_405977 [Lentithecium fluviatile CBS 122367]